MSEQHELLRARLVPAPIPTEQLAAGSIIEFMVMPAGEQTGNFSKSGKLARRTVLVEPASAAALQEQLAATNAARSGKQRAYFDFDHHVSGPAAAWPVEFLWKPSGVYCRAELSQAGAEAIMGKTYRGFSPVFHVTLEKPARVVAASEPTLNMGGFVNEPAFHENEPLWAKDQISATGDPGAVTEKQQQKETHMSEQTTAVAAPAATAPNTEAITAKENADLKQQLEALKAKDIARRQADAKSAVERAVKRGALPAQNEELKAKWQRACESDPESITMLDGIAGKEELTAKAAPAVATEGLKATEGPKRIIGALSDLLKQNRGIRGFDAVASQHRGELSRNIAKLYASDIKKNPDFLTMPVSVMAEVLQATEGTGTTLGTLYGTLVIQRCLEFFRLNYPMFKYIYTDFSDQPALFNQTLATRIISKPSVQTYDITLDTDGRPLGWATASAATTTDATCTLDEHVGVPVVFDSQILASTTRRLFDEIAPGMSYALASYFVAKIYALFTAANYNGYASVSGTKVPVAYATYAKSAGDFARSAVVDLNAIFNPNEVPLHDRCLLLNSAYYAALGKDPSLVTFWAGQRNPELITEGELPKMSKFVPIEAPDFPSSSNRVGMALQKNAVIAVSRLPQDYTKVLPGASYGNVTQITDPETGLTVLLVEYVNHTQGYAEMRMETMIGAAKGDKRAGLVITSA